MKVRKIISIFACVLAVASVLTLSSCKKNHTVGVYIINFEEIVYHQSNALHPAADLCKIKSHYCFDVINECIQLSSTRKVRTINVAG